MGPILKIKTFGFLVLTALIFIAIFALNQRYVVFTMSSNVSSEAKVYFDFGHGEYEENAASRAISVGAQAKYKFKFPKRSIRLLRFDPSTVASTICIKKIEIVDSLGSKISSVDLSQIYAVKDISEIKLTEQGLVVKTIDLTNDPILRISNSAGLNSVFHVTLKSVLKMALISLILICFVIIGKRLINLWIECSWYPNRVAEFIKIQLRLRPFVSIFFISLFFVAVSEYPIIFSGKSHLQYVGLPSLYHGPPYLPGLLDELETEDSRGSDIGAGAWSMVPNSFVQVNSIFKYREIPFWNRYYGGGLPLYGQGQSMLGDPLHWVVIAMKGSALGWDIKFILSKLFFVFGFSCLAYSLTRSTVIAVLASLSLPFIGFYSFRLDHPAYFIYTYSPWLILFWRKIGDSILLENPYRTSLFIFLLSVFAFFHLNSGAPKEAVILYGFSTLIGLALFWDNLRFHISAAKKISFFLSILLIQTLFSAPYWLVFLDTLSNSYTVYDTFISQTLNPFAFLSLFDNIFYQLYSGTIALPSLNLLSFVFLCFAAHSTLRGSASWIMYFLWATILMAGLFVFGFVPEAILKVLPFINRIMHYHNTFSSPMLFASIMLSFYGLSDFIKSDCEGKLKYINFAFYSLFVSSTFFVLLEPKLFGYSCFVIFAFWTVRSQLARCELAKFNQTLYGGLIILFVLFVIPKGLHLNFGLKILDSYITNPVARPDLLKASPTITYLKERITLDPSRVVGLDDVLFPGIYPIFLIEGIVHAEPLRTKELDDILKVENYGYSPWGWARLLKKTDIDRNKKLLDFFGVGYVLTDPRQPDKLNLPIMFSSDLVLYKRDSALPRAYYTSEIYRSNSVDELNKIFLVNKGPFAILSANDYAIFRKNFSSTQVISNPASDYVETGNTTSFKINAKGPGIVVLNESAFDNDFTLMVNGKKTKIIKVNYYAKGFFVNSRGVYTVKYIYRPKIFNLAILFMLAGFIMFAAFMAYLCFVFKREYLTHKVGVFV